MAPVQAGLDLLEWLEQPWNVGGADSRAGVSDTGDDGSAPGLAFDRNLAALRKLDGVTDQVQQDLFETALVGDDGADVRADCGAQREALGSPRESRGA